MRSYCASNWEIYHTQILTFIIVQVIHTLTVIHCMLQFKTKSRKNRIIPKFRKSRITLFYCPLGLSCGECNVISLYFMCCSVNGFVCLVCCVFVSCLVKQFAIHLCVVVILLLNVMDEMEQYSRHNCDNPACMENDNEECVSLICDYAKKMLGRIRPIIAKFVKRDDRSALLILQLFISKLNHIGPTQKNIYSFQ